ncbi:TPA: carboxymuconolactone decarboxylase family protein [Legionella pneumophila]|nr:carboxymuconolactone decarboxylase family protein [Legionella pneumophila]HAT8858128.1 carboxymuconolactone decarboxylase family protein [Legionella pneumophila subsp. pneumophila]HAT7074302.1 carboxymuconolactone decarboxylase family protein [Legionella pneumophila]HAT8643092.1 carboxymuconolactone decarboxylase family protein [Legionella pneumophila]HAT8869578.1 carboxymuconolactone decarboxylase family protein [Legionella pneumophila subsp. pneumophila]HAU0163556.1 carboxymuconolactone d
MDTKQLKNIDPALGLMNDFSKISLGTTSAIQQLRQHVIFKDGVLPAKIKALIAMVSGINARCEPCLSYYAIQAKTLGASETELGEVLAVVSTMGGCVGEMWALKAYKAFKEQDEMSDTCCEH